MKQKKFIFKYSYERQDRISSPLRWEMDAVITQHEVKSSLLKRGYLVKDVKSYPAIITVATVARANIPKAEREKMQKDMDSNEKPAN